MNRPSPLPFQIYVALVRNARARETACGEVLDATAALVPGPRLRPFEASAAARSMVGDVFQHQLPPVGDDPSRAFASTLMHLAA